MVNDVAFSKKLKAEYKKMLVDKWDEGIRIHCDPGNKFLVEWPMKHGKIFHEKWEKSKCKTCLKSDDCGFKEASRCDYYLPDPLIEKKNKKIKMKIIKIIETIIFK